MTQRAFFCLPEPARIAFLDCLPDLRPDRFALSQLQLQPQRLIKRREVRIAPAECR